MKCPICGDEIRNGRCRFCGYRETETDREARSKYEAQKAAFASGPPDTKTQGRRAGKARDRKPANPSGRGTPEKAAKAAGSGKASRQEGTAVPARPARASPKPRQRAAPAGNDGRKRRGLSLKGLLFNLLIILWVLAWILAIGSKLAAESRAGPDGSDSDSYQTGEISPGKGDNYGA